MFSWICPDCGAEVEASSDVCPNCSALGSSDSDSAPAGFDQGAAGVPPEPTASVVSAVTESPPQESPARSSLRSGLHLEKRHFVIFAVALVLAILVAVWAAGDSNGLFSGLGLEDPDEMAVSPVETFSIGVQGAVEVSGIRPYYDQDFQTHVKAFIANHSDEPQSVALQVLLRVREASRQAPPLATFDVVVPDPIGPNGGTEVDVVLHAMGSLQSLPPWHEIRVDVEPLASQGD